MLDYWSDGSFVSAAFRETLVRTYLALGREQDAAQVLEVLVNSGFERVHHPVIYVRALYTLGTLEIALGDASRGRELLERFLDHWGEADWDLPEVRDARRRIDADSAASFVPPHPGRNAAIPLPRLMNPRRALY